jgi:hypothetical protein
MTIEAGKPLLPGAPELGTITRVTPPADYRHGSVQAHINLLEAQNGVLRAALAAAKDMLRNHAASADKAERAADDIERLLARPTTAEAFRSGT